MTSVLSAVSDNSRQTNGPSAALFERQHRWLEQLAGKYHDPRFIPPDPLQRVRAYPDPADREVVGLIASALAYGNVKAILRGVGEIERRVGDHPARALIDSPPAKLQRHLDDCRYRVTSGPQLAALLIAARSMIRRHGSLHRSFVLCCQPSMPDAREALGRWVESMHVAAGQPLPHLLPDPAKGSACKRLFLYLRWMVRCDAVDPGGWAGVAPRLLIAPVDTHMHSVARQLGWTGRKQANLATALEITAALRRHRPDDPLRYDFALTRPGIRNEPMPVMDPPHHPTR